MTARPRGDEALALHVDKTCEVCSHLPVAGRGGRNGGQSFSRDQVFSLHDSVLSPNAPIEKPIQFRHITVVRVYRCVVVRRLTGRSPPWRFRGMMDLYLALGIITEQL